MSPALTGIFTIKPCIGAITVPSPALGEGVATVAGSAPAPADA